MAVLRRKTRRRSRLAFYPAVADIREMASVVFFHGLNTYGDDDVHIGPVKLGAMHEPLVKELGRRGIEVFVMPNLGQGSIEAQAERAAQELGGRHGLPTRFALLGQSTGGLVARVLAADPRFRERVNCILSVGTPHLGTLAARFGMEFGDRHRIASRVFSLVGYDTHAKQEIFRHFTPEAMLDFNSRYPSVVREVSLVCNVTGPDISWPLKFFFRRLHPAGESSDGFVWSESQRRGEVIGPLALDHFGELGYFPHLYAAARKRARSEFARLLDEIASQVSK